MEPTLHWLATVNVAVGDRTELVDTGRHGPRRRIGIAWGLLAITIAAASVAAWVLWEQGRIARDEAEDARHRLGDAHQRAAAAETQLLAMSADRLRGPASIDAGGLAQLAATLRERIDRAAGEVALDDASGTLVVTLDDPTMFRGHDADLTRRGEKVVDAIAAAIVASGDRAVWVHGHVDDAPLPFDAPFDSAWELSSARALAVLRRLADGGIEPRRLAAVAFGAERPAGKDRAKNRRIELVVDAVPVATPAAAMRASSRTR